MYSCLATRKLHVKWWRNTIYYIFWLSVWTTWLKEFLQKVHCKVWVSGYFSWMLVNSFTNKHVFMPSHWYSICTVHLLVCLFVYKKTLTLAITFEWYVIKISYFTRVFLVARPFLGCKGQGDQSRSNIKVMFFKKWPLQGHYPVVYYFWKLTLSQTSPGFLRVCCTHLLKTLCEKEKLLVTMDFSFSYSVFYPFEKLSVIFTKFVGSHVAQW